MTSAPHSPTQSTTFDKRYQFYGLCMAALNQKPSPPAYDFVVKLQQWIISYDINRFDYLHQAIAEIALEELAPSNGWQSSEESQKARKILYAANVTTSRGFVDKHSSISSKLCLIYHRALHPLASCLSKEKIQDLENFDENTSLSYRYPFFQEYKKEIDGFIDSLTKDNQLLSANLSLFDPQLEKLLTAYKIEKNDPLVDAVSGYVLAVLQSVQTLQGAKNLTEPVFEKPEIEHFKKTAIKNPDLTPDEFIALDKLLHLSTPKPM